MNTFNVIDTWFCFAKPRGISFPGYNKYNEYIQCNTNIMNTFNVIDTWFCFAKPRGISFPGYNKYNECIQCNRDMVLFCKTEGNFIPRIYLLYSMY